MITGIIILICVAIMIPVGFILTGVFWDSVTGVLSGIYALICCIFLLTALMGLTNRLDARSYIKSYEITKITIQDARKNKSISPYELAALQNTIIKTNADLVSNQYYARLPFFAMYYPSAILKLKPLR